MLDHEKRGYVLNTISRTRPSGFSLIELLIAVAVLVVLISLAVPSFKIWLQNSQIRNAAESIQNGLQRARAEAVARNTSVEFVLVDTDATCVAAGTCSTWKVQLPGGGGGPVTGTPIDSRSSAEGSADVKRTATLSTSSPASPTTVTFNNVGGRATTNANGSYPFTEVTLDSNILAAADSRELKIVIGVKDAGGNYVGGTVRMCDPSFPSVNPRGC